MRLESVVKNLVKKNWCGKKQITSADTSASTLQTTLEDFCYEVEVRGKVVSHSYNLNWTLERTPEISQKIFDEHFIHRGILELLASYLWTTTTTLSPGVGSPVQESSLSPGDAQQPDVRHSEADHLSCWEGAVWSERRDSCCLVQEGWPFCFGV